MIDKNELTTKIKLRKYLIFFSLHLQLPFLFLPSETYGIRFDLEETPPNTYTRCQRPFIESLPRKMELAVTPVKNQGPLGTCASFAVSACGEYYFKQQGLRFSEAEFTVLAETHLPSAYGGNCTPGVNLGKALEIGHVYGFVSEDQLPYPFYLRYVAKKNGIEISHPNWLDLLGRNKDPVICNRFRGHTPAFSYNRTMFEMGVGLHLSEKSTDIGYQLPEVYPIHHVSTNALARALQNQRVTENCIGSPGNADLEWVKYALSKGHPVATAIPVFGKNNKTNWDNDNLFNHTVLPPYQGEHVGFHAIVLTGYNDRNRTFRLKNSWGPDWGDHGFANISYSYIEKYATELVGVGHLY